MKFTFISLARNTFPEKKNGVETGKEIEYFKVNVSDETGGMFELAVHKELDREKVKAIKMGTNVSLAYAPDSNNQIRVIDVKVNKA